MQRKQVTCSCLVTKIQIKVAVNPENVPVFNNFWMVASNKNGAYEHIQRLLSHVGTYTQYWWFLLSLLQYLPQLNDRIPEPQPKGDYGTVILSPVVPLLDQRSRQKLGTEPIRSQFPLTFEELGQRYGFMLYETIVAHSVPDPAFFSIPNIRDRAIVLLDDVSSETVFFILHLCYCCCCFVYIYIYIHIYIHTYIHIHSNILSSCTY